MEGGSSKMNLGLYKLLMLQIMRSVIPATVFIRFADSPKGWSSLAGTWIGFLRRMLLVYENAMILEMKE